MTNGYKKECDFVRAINKKKFCDLSNNMKDFIKFIFKNVSDNDILKCERYRTKDKADAYIKLNNDVKNISIKSGKRVSVHAENIYSFINFLQSIGINHFIINYLLLYHYGDGTLNGTGKERMPSSILKEKYDREIKIFNKYVHYKNIIKKVSNRCLFLGTKSVNSADYIYYITPECNLYASKEEIVDYFCNNTAPEIIAPHFSYLIYQNWNRNIINNPKLESHRYYCQFKWPSIAEDLQNIRRKSKN